MPDDGRFVWGEEFRRDILPRVGARAAYGHWMPSVPRSTVDDRRWRRHWRQTHRSDRHRYASLLGIGPNVFYGMPCMVVGQCDGSRWSDGRLRLDAYWHRPRSRLGVWWAGVRRSRTLPPARLVALVADRRGWPEGWGTLVGLGVISAWLATGARVGHQVFEGTPAALIPSLFLPLFWGVIAFLVCRKMAS